jgi:uncharacterized protein (DUF488 family)
MSASIVSIGYEGRTLSELVALLLAHHVQKVVDIRELPLSRRKGFSKTPLSKTLRDAGIDYQHLRIAGNPHRRLKADTARCLALYSQHIAAHPEVVDVVSAALETPSVAVLCFERRHDACHRSPLLEAVKQAHHPSKTIIRVE